MEDFIKSVLGNYTIGQYFAYFFFSILGVICFSWLEVSNRDKSSPKTPFNFTWKFFALDNIKRYVATIIFIYVQFRFFDNMTGTELSEYVAFLVGFGSDGLAGFSKRNIDILQADREKLLNNK